MRINDVSPERLRELAAHEPERGKVLSVYLNLDPERFSTGPARKSEVRSLIHDAHQQVGRAEHELSRAARMVLREDLRRVEELLNPGTPPPLPADGAQGLVVFASGPANLLEVLRTPLPVPSHAFVEDTPHLTPLVTIGVPEQWCVALVTRGAARYFLGPAEALREKVIDGFDEPIEIEGPDPDEAPRHMRRAAFTLARLEREGRFARLLIGVVEDLRSVFEDHLHPYVKKRLVGTIDVDAAHATAAEVSEETMRLARGLHRKKVQERLQILQAHVDRHDRRGAVGAASTLAALQERRVQSLLLAGDFAVPGTSCPRCGRLGADPAEERCPVDDEPLEHRDDVVDHAIHAAVDQDAEVLYVEPHESLALGIAALLRY
ncbi:MAG: hypothetical protein JWO02_416 [Solirubrobacterales bacterium]|nr:hypothetical protein [Solirubrobacterales bacterium]